MTGGYGKLIGVGASRHQSQHMLGENGKAGRVLALSAIGVMNRSVAEEMRKNKVSAYSFPW